MLEEIVKKMLEINDDWDIYDSKMDIENKRFDFFIRYHDKKLLENIKNKKDESGKYYDFIEKQWRNDDYHGFAMYINAKVPRIKYPDGSIAQIDVPWARKGINITKWFEMMIVATCKCMTVKSAAHFLGVNEMRCWRTLLWYVAKAMGYETYESVEHLGLDETSIKGHHYLTLFVDTENRKSIFCIKGKNTRTIKKFVKHFQDHKGKLKNIKTTTCDMSWTFRKAIKKYCPNTKIIIDKFHVIKYFNECIDKTRRVYWKDNRKEFNKVRYFFLKNKCSLKKKQLKKRDFLMAKYPEIQEAVTYREEMQSLYDEKMSLGEAKKRFQDLIDAMSASTNENVLELVKTLKNNYEDIVQYWKYRYTNAILEGFNSKIQSAKSQARGYKCFEWFRTIIYLLTAKLNWSNIFPHNPYENNILST